MMAKGNRRTRVKFCGITRSEDAEAASHLGVDAVGFVFYSRSPRAISAEVAAKVSKCLSPFVTKVGLFVNADPKVVRATLKLCKLDLLQFHGDETEGYCQQFNVPYMKAIRHQSQSATLAEIGSFGSSLGVLLDTYETGRYGGTGQAFDWDDIPKFNHPLILAGGLTPDNVARAIRQVAPMAVDVSGGVEKAPGEKDFDKMVRFLEAVKSADNDLPKVD